MKSTWKNVNRFIASKKIKLDDKTILVNKFGVHVYDDQLPYTAKLTNEYYDSAYTTIDPSLITKKNIIKSLPKIIKSQKTCVDNKESFDDLTNHVEKYLNIHSKNIKDKPSNSSIEIIINNHLYPEIQLAKISSIHIDDTQIWSYLDNGIINTTQIDRPLSINDNCSKQLTSVSHNLGVFQIPTNQYCFLYAKWNQYLKRGLLFCRQNELAWYTLYAKNPLNRPSQFMPHAPGGLYKMSYYNCEKDDPHSDVYPSYYPHYPQYNMGNRYELFFPKIDSLKLVITVLPKPRLDGKFLYSTSADLISPDLHINRINQYIDANPIYNEI